MTSRFRMRLCRKLIFLLPCKMNGFSLGNSDKTTGKDLRLECSCHKKYQSSKYLISSIYAVNVSGHGRFNFIQVTYTVTNCYRYFCEIYIPARFFVKWQISSTFGTARNLMLKHLLRLPRAQSTALPTLN